MKKIDKVVLKETRYVAIITVILSALMQAVFLVCGIWTYKHLLGNVLGAVSAVTNFLAMGITVQKALVKEEKEAKSLIKFSQSARLFGLLVIALIGHLLPFFNTLAIIVPFLFPRVAVMLRPFIIKD